MNLKSLNMCILALQQLAFALNQIKSNFLCQNLHDYLDLSSLEILQPLLSKHNRYDHILIELEVNPGAG